MIIKAGAALLFHLLLVAVEAPHIVRHRLRREWALLLALTLLNALLSAVVIFRLPIAGPGRWLELLFRPIGQMLGGR